MPAEQLWRRKVHQPAIVLVDETVAFDIDVPVLSGRMQWRTHPSCLGLDHGHGFRGLLGADHRRIPLDDPGFLAGDRRQAVTEKFRMIHADRRDDGSQRRIDHIGGIEPAPKADFEQQHVGGMLREQDECRRGFGLEDGDWRAGIGALALLQRFAQFIITGEHAATATSKTNALIEPHEMGRGIDVNAQACGFQNRAQIGDRRSLAVGARDMDHRRQLAFGMTKRFQEPMHSLQAEIDGFRMQCGQPHHHVTKLRRRHGRRPVHACGAAGTVSGAVTICAGVTDTCTAGFARGSGAGDLVNRRHSRASVARMSWRCTTISTMP